MKKIILLLISISLLFVFSCASDKNQDGAESTQSPLKNGKLQEPEDFEEPLVRDLDPETQKTSPRNPRPKSTKKAQDTDANAGTTANSDGASKTNDKTAKKDDASKDVKTTDSKSTETKASESKTASAEAKKETPKTAQNTTAPKSQNQATANKANTAQAKTATPNQTNTPSAPRNTLDKRNTPAPGTPKQTVPSQNKTTPAQNKNNTATSQKKSEDFFVLPEGFEEPPAEQSGVSSDKKPVPSRSVQMKTNETLSITYPGSGWIYLGSTSEYNNLESTGKRTLNNETIFTLVSRESGKQIHHFYKLDNLTGKFIDDYIEVDVQGDKGSLYTVVKAPEYKNIVPKQPETPAISSKTLDRINAEKEAAEAAGEISITPVDNAVIPAEPKEEILPNEKRDFVEYTGEEEYTPNIVEPEETTPKIDINPYTELKDASELLEKAKQFIADKKYQDAELCLKAFFEISTEKRDEGLYLLGQVYEQDSPVKNIKASINSYQNLMDNYPESNYYEEANKRIIYLKRFYIEIR